MLRAIQRNIVIITKQRSIEKDRKRSGFVINSYRKPTLHFFWERRLKKPSLLERALGFSVFRFWPCFRSVFRFLQWKNSVFRFCCPLWFPVFPFFSIWCFVFWAKITRFFGFWWPMWISVFPISKKVKDKATRAPNVVFVVVSHYQLPSSYIFALTSMSFLDLPLL